MEDLFANPYHPLLSKSHSYYFYYLPTNDVHKDDIESGD